MIWWTALAIAFKKFTATLPVLAIVNAITIPILFSQVAEFLGPHVLAGFGAVLGSAIRFHLLKMAWRGWPLEAVFAGLLGTIFGQANIPVVGTMLERVSPDMLPVAQGTSIGILMAAGTGFLSDFIKAYRSKPEGGAK